MDVHWPELDEDLGFAGPTGRLIYQVVMPGLDPGIHQSSKESRSGRDCRGIQREDELRAFARQ
jgi:hypothetical protein